MSAVASLSEGKVEELVARDGARLRCASFSQVAPRGHVVLLTGRSEFIEKHLETVGELLTRGFSVHTMDWRGQGLSERPLAAWQRGHVRDFSAYVGDLALLVERLVPSDAPRLILAHSMGAHVALRWMNEQAPELAAAVFTAPMLDIATGKLPKKLVRNLVRLAVQAGAGERYALGMRDYDPNRDPFAGNDITRDPERFALRSELIRRNPRLALGGVTWGWLDAAFRSIDLVAEPGYLERISTPVLIVAAGADTVVSRAAIERGARALPHAQLVVVPGARHELLHELDVARSALWRAFDAHTATLVAPRR